jgi:hypothetical protein
MDRAKKHNLLPFEALPFLLLIEVKEGFEMASKRAANHKGQGVTFAPGTRHNGVHPSLSTLTRLPLDIPMGAMPTRATVGARREFILALLTQAGAKGITWAEIRADLIKAFGSAPKKRAALYSLLSGQVYHKVVGSKGVVAYVLGKAPRRKARP